MINGLQNTSISPDQSQCQYWGYSTLMKVFCGLGTWWSTSTDMLCECRCKMIHRYRKNERYQDSEHHYMYVALPMATSIHLCHISSHFYSTLCECLDFKVSFIVYMLWISDTPSYLTPIQDSLYTCCGYLMVLSYLTI